MTTRKKLIKYKLYDHKGKYWKTTSFKRGESRMMVKHAKNWVWKQRKFNNFKIIYIHKKK